MITNLNSRSYKYNNVTVGILASDSTRELCLFSCDSHNGTYMGEHKLELHKSE